jgi:cysteine desulfurase
VLDGNGRVPLARGSAFSSTIQGAKSKFFDGLCSSAKKMMMMPQRVYLDWNATAPLHDEARAAMTSAFGLVGNPSSIHGEGRQARHLVEQARTQVASLVGAEPRDVTFTSAGTEANVLALTPAIEISGAKPPRDRLLMSAIEHPSVQLGHRFPTSQVEQVSVTTDGVIDLSALRTRLAELGTQGVRPLVSIMHGNNETGVVQPIAEAAAIVHAAGGLLHVDAVQTAGRIDCDINTLDADMLTLSGHKLGGPKGVGALVKRSDALHFADPVIRGGGQERGSRAGTENVIGIIGFGAAAATAARRGKADATGMARLRERLETGLRAISAETVVFGLGVERVPNTTLFAIPDIKAETALIALDLEGIAASSGAACSSGKVSASHVLAAMGVAGSLAHGAIRVSLGPTTREDEIDFFLKAWRKLVMGLSKGRGVAA